MEHTRVIAGEEERLLPVPLSEERCSEIAYHLAQKVSDLSDLDEERAAVLRDFQAKRKQLAASIETFAENINRRTETVSVRCEILHDYTKRMVETRRSDTQEIVASRPMKEAEYRNGVQQRLE